MCTLDIGEDGLEINAGSGAASPEDSGKFFLSNVRLRQRPVQTGKVALPNSGHSLLQASNRQAWLKDVFLEGSALSARVRGLDVGSSVAVYMEGTLLLL